MRSTVAQSLPRRVGVHTSIAGGVQFAAERARELGCGTMQIFSHNPRQWSAAAIPDDQVVQFRDLRKRYDIAPVFVHTSYLINLAAQKSDLLERSVALLIREMDLADQIGAEYVVLHTGSASYDEPANARRRAIGALRQVSRVKKWGVRLLLENTAGERGDISSRIADIAEMIDAVESPMIGGICLDSCHAFAAGYDLADAEQLHGLADEVERLLGRDSVRLIHLNDSKKGLGAGVDRHEHLGQGGIGLDALKAFITHPLFCDVPLVLETPKKTEEDDPRNLKIVRSLVD
ncbi:MAG TPA: deoxyribonuclease IV [Dissulfurispiraceae bacterium]|nr:deoxyribonuclease IV [Dissulfurispiraceae bacterium]